MGNIHTFKGVRVCHLKSSSRGKNGVTEIGGLRQYRILGQQGRLQKPTQKQMLMGFHMLMGRGTRETAKANIKPDMVNKKWVRMNGEGGYYVNN